MYRPDPPKSLLELSGLSAFGIRMTPALEVWDWIQSEILADTGSIHNEDHAHLLDADIKIIAIDTCGAGFYDQFFFCFEDVNRQLTHQVVSFGTGQHQ